MAIQGSQLIPNAYAEDTADIATAGRVSPFSEDTVFTGDIQNVAIRATAMLKSVIDPLATYMGFQGVDETFDIYDIEFDTKAMGRNTKPVSFVMDILQGTNPADNTSFKHVTKAVFHLRNLIDDQSGRIHIQLMANTFIMTLVEAYHRGRIGGFSQEGRNEAKVAQGFMVSNSGRWHKHTEDVAAHYALTALDGGAQSFHLFDDMNAEQRAALKSSSVRYADVMRYEVEKGLLMQACQLLSDEWRFPTPTDDCGGTTSTKVAFKLFNNNQERTAFIRVSPEDFATLRLALKSSWTAVVKTNPNEVVPLIDVAEATPIEDDSEPTANDLAALEAPTEAANEQAS